MCAKSSYRIFKELLKKGISARFCLSRNHAFVKVNNIIIDVTATQFERHELDSHKVLIGKLSELPDIRWAGESIWDEYKGTDTLNGVKELLEDWPAEQQPRFVKSTKL